MSPHVVAAMVLFAVAVGFILGVLWLEWRDRRRKARAARRLRALLNARLRQNCVLWLPSGD